jgi:acyl carrier protein
MPASRFNMASSVVKRVSLALSTPYAAPSDELEMLATTTYAEAFNVDHVGVDDKFFELGGDSLIAEVLSMALSEQAGFDFQPSAVFEFDSPKQVASLLRARLREAVPCRQPPLSLKIEEKIRVFISGWRGERTGAESLVLGLNRTGKKRPFFWCLQESEEFNQLALHFGPERPLYGMRSGYLAMSYTKANIAALARRYADEILEIDATGPYVIAGNCQGGIVAVEIARQLQQTGRQILLLTTLDTVVWDLLHGQTYPGKVAFFFGIHSRFNPYRRFRSPALGWRKLFPQGLRLDLLPADHGGYFTDHVMRIFVQKLQSALDWAEEATPPIAGDASSIARLPEGTHHAQIQTLQTLSMRPGQPGIVSVRVTNVGSATWAPTVESGIALGNHWLTSGGELLVWADGRTPLHEPVTPGGQTTLDLQVRAPSDAGEYLLEIDLVEEGVTWFKEKGSQAAAVRVIVDSEAAETFERSLIRYEATSQLRILDLQKELGEAIAQRDNRILELQKELGEAIAQRDNRILELQKELGEAIAQRDSRILDLQKELGEAIAQRDSRILELQKEIEDRAARALEIQSRAEARADKAEARACKTQVRLDSLINSTSWRITAPLRITSSVLTKLRRAIRRSPTESRQI